MLFKLFVICNIFFEISGDPFRIELKKHVDLKSMSLYDFQSNVDYYKYGLESYMRQIGQTKFDKNVEYSGYISIAKPKQNFMTFFDTSFSALWVISEECNWSYYYVCDERKNKYKNKDSTTYTPDEVGNRTDVNIGGYELEIEGVYTLDSLWLGTSDEIYDQQFLAVSSFCTNSKLCMLEASLIPDGVFGLGFPSSQLMMGPPLFTVMDRGLISEPVFSLYINRSGDQGELLIGGHDKSLFDVHSLYYVDVNEITNKWSIDIESITLNQKELCDEKCAVLLDTGTALIAAPRDRLQLIYNILGKENEDTKKMVKVSCSTIPPLPILKFYINQKLYTMSGVDYVVKLKDSCVLGFMENLNSPNWILGYLFLKNFYTIFNFESKKVGFANNAESEKELYELARLVGVNIEFNTLRLLILLLEEGYPPETVYAMYYETIK